MEKLAGSNGDSRKSTKREKKHGKDYSFSYNHGSEKWLYLKGNYYWRDPFLTSMIMGGKIKDPAFHPPGFHGSCHDGFHSHLYQNWASSKPMSSVMSVC